jgi:hypothetical protein
MNSKEKPSTSSVLSAATDVDDKSVLKNRRKTSPLRPTTSAKGSTGTASILAGLLATPMPVRVWALAKMRSTHQEKGGFPGDGLTTS